MATISDSSLDLLQIKRGLITAPAGCGKTQLIADALKRHEENKPVLVLTHTNAGVASLRGRLSKARVSPKAYRLATIDGWAMRLVSTFPKRSAIDPTLLALENPKTDYPNIRVAAANLLKAGHLQRILAANYSRLVVDEYQDCSIRQHAVLYYAAETLPSCVLGDPLQSIFGFGEDRIAKWIEEVGAHFPLVGELSTPWRWINAKAEPLGEWLLECRKKLLDGRPIDLGAAPEQVTWVQLDGKTDHEKRLSAARTTPPNKDGTVLIIGDSKKADSRYQIAGAVPGAVTVEAVDLRDLVAFAAEFELTKGDALRKLAAFAQTMMTNVSSDDFSKRISSLRSGTARLAPSDAELAGLSFMENPTFGNATKVLAEIGRQGGVRAYRPALLRACLQAMQMCSSGNAKTFSEAAILVREQHRILGRSLPRRAVGSTLLLKGLEADVAVILSATDLNASNFYVAATRGSQRLVVCSPTRILTPH